MRKYWILGVIIGGLGLIGALFGVGIEGFGGSHATAQRHITEIEYVPAAEMPFTNDATLMRIDGSTVNALTPSVLRTGVPLTLCFNVTVYSPDLEYMDRFEVDLPDSWTVNDVASAGDDSLAGVNAGNVVYWQSLNYGSGWGTWENGTYDFCATVTLPGCTGSPWSLPWTIFGDQYGSEPHSVNGVIAARCLAPGLYFTPETLAWVTCAAVTQTHILNLWNYTGADGVFTLSYPPSTSPITLDGPLSLTLAFGADADFMVSAYPAACVPAGVQAPALVTATGNGYTAQITLTATFGAESLWENVATGDEPALYWGHSYYDSGKLCFVGGIGGTSSPQASTAHRCYDLSTRTWSARAPLPAARFAGAYGLIGAYFYLAGGFDSNFKAYRTFYIYDIAHDSWSTGEELPTARGGQASGVIDGKLYSAGGSPTSSYPADCPTYVYDPTAHTWTTKADCPLQDSYGFLLGGSVDSAYHHRLFAGGHYGAYNGWYAYNPTTDVWEKLSHVPYHRTPLLVEDPRNGQIYLLGGLLGWNPQHGVWAYDYTTDTWDDSPPDFTTARGGSLGPRHGSFGDPSNETFWILGGTAGGGALTPAPFERWRDCPFCAERGRLKGTVMDAESPGHAPVTSAVVFLEPGKLTLPVNATDGHYGPVDLIAWTYTATAYAPGYISAGPEVIAITAGVTRTQVFALSRPAITVLPPAVAVTTYANSSFTSSLALTNTGQAPLDFRIVESNLPTTITHPMEARKQGSASITIEPQLIAELVEDETTGYLIRFRERPDLTPAFTLDWEARGRFVMQTLQATAERSQARVRAYLDARGVRYRAFWIANVIVVEASNRAVVNGLLGYSEVAALQARRTFSMSEYTPDAEIADAAGIEPNLTHIGAAAVWNMGFSGAGIVVAGIDTGVRYTHHALLAHYRGNLGHGLFVHDYNWLDADSGNVVPYDDHGHGSHTMGIMIGDDGAGNQIGVAPGARWIACDACNADIGCPDAALLTCAEWILAPYPMADPRRRDPAKRPHIVNNSWGDCGRAYDDWFQSAVDAWHAAGIYPVFSNGNAGNCGYPSPPGLNTVSNPARYGTVTGVGSTGQSNGLYAPHSNWGPTDNLDTVNPRGYAALKPQVVAPGVNIRSSLNSGDTAYAAWGGTSMSAPHVAGLIALIWEAGPCLIGDYAATETLIEQTATPIPYGTQNGDEGPGNVPNHATGWGEINALAAVQAAIAACDVPWLTVQPLTGTIGGPGTARIDLAIGCPAPGQYAGALKVLHNDPTTKTLQIPVTLTCKPQCVPLTTVDFIWEPLSPQTGQEVVFSALPPTITASLPITYVWDFGDGGTASGDPITHTYLVSGTYPVHVTAINDCSSVTMTHLLTVSGDIITPRYGVTLTPSVAEGSGQPGTTVVYTLSVENTGNVGGIFRLEASNALWPTTLTATQVFLSSGAKTTVNVRVHIPPHPAIPKDAVTITVHSADDTAVRAQSTLTTTVILPIYLPLVIKGQARIQN